jgi:DNA-binding transcriptional MerR regulator
MAQHTNETIRLAALAEAVGFDRHAAQRWLRSGLIRGENLGRGGFRGVRFTHDEALEVVAIALLRRAGLPLQQIRPAVLDLRAKGKTGRDVFTVGTLGKRALRDGKGDTFPLQEAYGQGVLPLLAFDLRPLRAESERLVRQLAAEELEREGDR